jgi:methanogenic corrinoid protein MtbC1
MNDLSAFLPGGGIAPELVETFAARLCGADDEGAADIFNALCAQGVEPEAVMLELLAPAARLLGELWCRDDANFLEVTIGLGRIHRLLRRLEMPNRAVPQRGAVLLLPVPGEQHVLGLRIVQEFLLRAGWRADLAVPPDLPALRRLLGGTPYDIVGLSISGDRLLPNLRSVINDIRAVPGSRDIRIMVGGAILCGGNVNGLELGADAVIRDAQGAVDQAELWFGLVDAQ